MPDTDAALGIELERLTKRYPGMADPAVDDVTMSIPAGELVVFVGPSGCGKTTTMKMINRLIEPTSGSIRLGGEDVTHGSAVQLRRRIGYVTQSGGLFPHMTIAENIAQVPLMLRWKKRQIEDRVEELLGLVGLDPGTYARRYPRQLSGGQQQRVGVARALAADPPVLLMDEPFGATDPITRLNLQREFRRLQQELAKTVIFVTHDFEEALLLGDKIAVLAERSRIVQYGPPLELVGRPADEHVGHFVGGSAHVRLLGLLQAGLAAQPGLSGPGSGPDAGAGTDGAHADDGGQIGGRATVSADATLRDVVDLLLGGVPVVTVRHPDGTVAGGLDFAAVQKAVEREILDGATASSAAPSADLSDVPNGVPGPAHGVVPTTGAGR